MATAVAIGAVLIARCGLAYTHPILWGDDWNLLVRFVHAPGPDAIFQTYSGYVSVVPSMIGWVASHFPSGARPYLFAWAAWGIGVASLSWFSSPRFAHLFPDVRYRSLACVLLALLPASNHALLAALMFSSWHLLFVLALATLAQPPSRMRPMLGEITILAACICSHPLSIAMAPFFGSRAATARTRIARGFYGALSAVACLYFFAGVESGRTVLPDAGSAILASTEMLTHRIVGASVLHGTLRAEVPVSLASCILLLLPVAAVIGYGLRRKAGVRHGILTLLLIVLVLVAAITMGRFEQHHKLLFSPRYTYVPTLCWYLAATIVLLSAARACPPRLRVVTIAALVVHTATLNHGQRYLYRTSRSTGDRVVRFSAGIDPWLQSGRGPDTRTLALPGRRLDISRPRPAPR